MVNKRFTSNEMAEILKGTANHYRLEIMVLLSKKDRLSVEAIAEELKANYKTIAAHISRLHRSGLINKRYKASAVEHQLTKRGNAVLKFLRILE